MALRASRLSRHCEEKRERERWDEMTAIAIHQAKSALTVNIYNGYTHQQLSLHSFSLSLTRSLAISRQFTRAHPRKGEDIEGKERFAINRSTKLMYMHHSSSLRNGKEWKSERKEREIERANEKWYPQAIHKNLDNNSLEVEHTYEMIL